MAYNGTVQDFIEDGTVVTLWCHNARCQHRGPMDLLLLRSKIGPDAVMNFDHIKHHFHCSQCGGKEFGMTSKKAPVNPYARESR
jgi:hypothetical protein